MSISSKLGTPGQGLFIFIFPSLSFQYNPLILEKSLLPCFKLSANPKLGNSPSPLIDAVIRGEGELPSLGLADNLKQGNKDFSNINGLYWKDKEGNIKINKPCPGVPNLDEIDMRWDLVNPQHYIRDIDGKKWLGVITSRGCPFRCGFCYNISFFGMSKFRGWSPKKSIEEIKKVLEWGVNFVNFDDDYIFGDPLRMWKILDLKKEEGLDFNWKAPIRGHLLRDSLTKRIKEGGCSSVTIGA